MLKLDLQADQWGEIVEKMPKKKITRKVKYIQYNVLQA